MCKVRITNYPNNYTVHNNTILETEMSASEFEYIKTLFEQLNAKRTNACMPNISIEKI